MDVAQFTDQGKFLMLALDHRASFKKLLNPQQPESVTDQEAISLKAEIINTLKDQFSSLLIDETYGLAAYPTHQTPFLLPLERSGYQDQLGERVTELEYQAAQLRKLGASGAKLLIYFNPQLASAKVQLETVRLVREDCQKNNLPLFLEIVTYTPEVSPQSHIGSGIDDKAGLVIESVRSFYQAGIVPDVWKLEYPGDAEACLEITRRVSGTPWILLTGGASFEDFQRQLKEAVSAGASGFLAGRALWQEVCQLQGEEKEQFLKQVLPERFKTIAEIVKTG